MYGKDKANRGGLKFSEWVQEMFPGLGARDASDAIWWASNSDVTTEIPAGLSHPQNIRQWFNATQTAQAVPEDLQDVAPAATLQLPQRDAERVAKTILRAQSGDG